MDTFTEMTARLLGVCLVAFLIAVSVQSNPQGKHGSLSKQSSKVEAAESSASSDGDGGILPTFFPFEASSLEPGEEDMSEVLGRADTGALEVFDKEEENTPTLLSDEVLARLLQSSEEEQQAVGEDEEYEEEKEEVEAEEENEAAKGEDQQQEGVEVRSSAAVEIPVDLDYNVDNEVTDASSTKLDGSKTWTSESVGEELPTDMADYDSQQSTAAKNPKEGSEEVDQAVSTEVSEDEQEQRHWNTVKDKRSQPAEEEEGTSARRRRAKGRRKNTQHMKKVQNMRSVQASSGRARRREREPNNNFPMMHRAKIPMLDLNPEQFLATADLNPRTRTTARARPGARGQGATADPCENFHCKRGKACELNHEMEPCCVCQQLSHCPSANFPELEQVCGTDNQTYETSCQLFATKCYLEGTKKGHSLHLDYTGPCKLIPPCLHTELLQFPLRMRDWLKNILLQLYEHDSVTPGLLTDKQRVRVQKLQQSKRRLHAGDHPIELLALDFEKNYKLYIYPVHWQFAQLDKDPMDRLLSHSELAPLRAPLVPMEHCTSVFFGACDTDWDGLLSLSEWCQCLGLQHEDMAVQLLF